MSQPSRSPYFQSLYGQEYADELEDFLKSLDPDLNKLVQGFAYDMLWSREGLSHREKSLITLTVLVATGRAEQLPLHIRGFLHCGGSVEDLRNIFIHIIGYSGFPSVLTAFRVLNEVVKEIDARRNPGHTGDEVFR